MKRALLVLCVSVFGSGVMAQENLPAEISVPAVAPAEPANKNTNSGFESRIDAWSVYAGKGIALKKEVRDHAKENPKAGKFCLRITDKWAEVNPYVLKKVKWAATDGKPVLKFFVRAKAPQKFRAGFQFFGHDNAGKETFLGTSFWNFSADTQWQERSYTLKGEVPAGTDTVGITLIPTERGNDALTGEIFVDEVQLYSAE